MPSSDINLIEQYKQTVLVMENLGRNEDIRFASYDEVVGRYRYYPMHRNYDECCRSLQLCMERNLPEMKRVIKEICDYLSSRLNLKRLALSSTEEAEGLNHIRSFHNNANKFIGLLLTDNESEDKISLS